MRVPAPTATAGPTQQPLLHIHCSGTPFDIGYIHGSAAKAHIHRSLGFYTAYFQQKARLDWPSATATAERFLPFLTKQYPHLVEEMSGVAAGAGVGFSDILALNVRTEISMGLMSDGCTSLYCSRLGADGSGLPILAQNWDWERAQRDSLVVLHIASSPASGEEERNGRSRRQPAISLITEGGIIGKIGLNSSGVGICMNAIRARGVDFARLPVHLAMRSVLECSSHAEALALLTTVGVASSCHLLIADSSEGGVTGLECSYADILPLQVNEDGLYTHTNHWLLKHAGSDGRPITEALSLTDSVPRLKRLNSLLVEEKGREGGRDPVCKVEELLEDETNYPGSINKAPSPGNGAETLFSIVMDLKRPVAKVRIGRPTEAVDSFELRFDEKTV